MEKRLLLVFALTFIVILAFQPILKKYLPTPPPPASQAAPEKNRQATSGGSPEVSQAPAAVPVVTSGSARQAKAEAPLVIENDIYRITFSNRGALVKSWIVKKFEDDNGHPLELVNTAAAQQYGYPMSLFAYDESLRNKLNSALYITESSGTLKTPVEVSFEYSDQDVAVRKTFKFDDTYVLHVDTAVTAKGAPVSAFPMWPSGFGDETSTASYAAAKIEYQFNSNVERLTAKKVSSGATIKGPFNWASVNDQYFAAVFLPDNASDANLITLHNGLDVPKDPKNPQDTTKVDVLGAAVGSLSGTSSQRVFVGPKSLNVLESVHIAGMGSADPDLRQLIDYGWLGVLSRPLFLWLKWTYAHIVPNWGWAIVVQTLIISLALLPLRISSMKSALKMAKVQPQMKAIQERYKKYSMRDPKKQEMNAEIAALMKSEGVSPAGGCVPLIIQMPFLFAYYRMLGVAIELRHAHWLWISDLSARDPYYILPILLIVSMLLTQRMTPQTGMDPSQQKMMNVMMPLFMGFIFFNLAAGLTLYYGESNLVGIIQQMVMNRTSL
ncbi:MAG: membrane protein insertase YidC, partial [Acidobacteriales bacterium]|nr:membrane protein insertase YidC [Terriglobales bacterium]